MGRRGKRRSSVFAAGKNLGAGRALLCGSTGLVLP